jgi:hypothetical protein
MILKFNQIGQRILNLKVNTFVLILTTLSVTHSYAQRNNGGILGDIIKGAKDIKQATREIKGATNEITSTVKSVKNLQKTWSKDPSPNIRYKQNPDYRTREEVTIEKNQKLSVVNGEFKNLQWSPITYYNREVFPSFIIGWSFYQGVKEFDRGSSLGFDIRNNYSKTLALKWEIESSNNDFFSIDSGYVNINSRQSMSFMPKINWNYKNLTKLQSSVPLNIKFRLIDPITGLKTEKFSTINLRSINDCLRFDDKGNDIRYMYAAYVNEDHPEISKILREALNTKMVTEFKGYQGSSKEVLLEVAAINRVLHDRGFQYSNITNNSGVDEGEMSSQSIRTFDNAIKTNQANCVDGTVVFASILKRIGITPLIITKPGHCYLGFYTDENNSELNFLETTALSEDNYLKNPKKYSLEYKDVLQSFLPKNVKLNDKNKAYFLQFLDARQYATTKHSEAIKAGKKVNLYNVVELRKQIRPIPFYD